MSRRHHAHHAPTADHGTALSAVSRPKAAAGNSAIVVALTGAASFLGSALLAQLELDDHVKRIIALDVRRPHSVGPKTHLYDVDLTQPTAEAHLAEILAAEHVDTLVHLAFLTSPTPATAWAHEFESIGTRQMLIAATHAGVRKVVMGSQTLLYGAHRDNPNYMKETQPLRAGVLEPFFADKIEAEHEAEKFAQRQAGTVVTVLRFAPILGPTIQSYLTRYLARRVIPTLMGFDPLLQFIHETDAVAMLKLVVDADHAGTFNITGDGVLRLSAVIALIERTALPLPQWVVQSVAGLGWAAQLVDVPPTFLPYLRYICVADDKKARDALGFAPTYSSRSAVVEFARAVHRRDANLLHQKRA